MANPSDMRNLALFCDFENIALGVRDAHYDRFEIRRVLERLLLKGSIVVKKDQVFDPREVALGTKADGFYEIKSGLLEGEQVVTSGNFLIDSESRLRSALEGAGGGGHVHGG